MDESRFSGEMSKVCHASGVRHWLGSRAFHLLRECTCQKFGQTHLTGYHCCPGWGPCYHLEAACVSAEVGDFRIIKGGAQTRRCNSDLILTNALKGHGTPVRSHVSKARLSSRSLKHLSLSRELASGLVNTSQPTSASSVDRSLFHTVSHRFKSSPFRPKYLSERPGTSSSSSCRQPHGLWTSGSA